MPDVRIDRQAPDNDHRDEDDQRSGKQAPPGNQRSHTELCISERNGASGQGGAESFRCAGKI